jgi:hypothetical protein
VLGIAIGSGALRGAPSIWVRSASTGPGAGVQVDVNYATDTNTPSLQFDLLYSTTYLSVGTPVPGSALSDHVFSSSEVSPGDLRVVIFSFSNSPITNGSLARVPFTVASDSPDHDESLTLSNVIVDTVISNNAYVVPVSVTNGALAILVPPRFTSIYRTNGGAMHLQLAGGQGRTYLVEAVTNLALPRPWPVVILSPAGPALREMNDNAAPAYPTRFYRASVVRPY